MSGSQFNMTEGVPRHKSEALRRRNGRCRNLDSTATDSQDCFRNCWMCPPSKERSRPNDLRIAYTFEGFTATASGSPRQADAAKLDHDFDCSTPPAF